MKATFNIASLIAMSPTMGYIPQFGTAVNKLLSSRDKIEYELALKQATEIALGYEVKTPYEMKDYGINPNASFAGVPLFQPLTLKGTESGESNLLLDSAVVSWNLPKTIVKTIVQGRDSSVKEFINNGDYIINVSGLICSAGWQYPLEKVITFDRFMKKKTTIEIEHEILNALGVFEIVIENVDCPKSPHINCQQYSFSAVSDTPIPLKVSDLPTSFNI